MHSEPLPPTNEVWDKVIFSVACVKNSVHRGVWLSACWDATPPGPGTPAADTPLEQTPQTRHPPRADPPMQCMLGDMVNKWAVCILLECNLVVSLHVKAVMTNPYKKHSMLCMSWQLMQFNLHCENYNTKYSNYMKLWRRGLNYNKVQYNTLN